MVTVKSEAMEKPLVLAESGFMIEYLIDHFGPWLAPEKYRKGQEGQVGGETEEWTRYRYFMHYAEGSLMPFLVMALVFNSKLTIHHQTTLTSLTRFLSSQSAVSVLYQTSRHDVDERRRVQIPQPKFQNPL